MPATLPRSLGLALFRLHIENGLAVAFGMLVVGAGFYAASGLSVTVLAYIGAFCVSTAAAIAAAARCNGAR